MKQVQQTVAAPVKQVQQTVSRAPESVPPAAPVELRTQATRPAPTAPSSHQAAPPSSTHTPVYRVNRAKRQAPTPRAAHGPATTSPAVTAAPAGARALIPAHHPQPVATGVGGYGAPAPTGVAPAAGSAGSSAGGAGIAFVALLSAAAALAALGLTGLFRAPDRYRSFTLVLRVERPG